MKKVITAALLFCLTAAVLSSCSITFNIGDGTGTEVNPKTTETSVKTETSETTQITTEETTVATTEKEEENLFVGVWKQTYHTDGMADEYVPTATFTPAGLCELYVNLYEGMSIIHASYEVEENVAKCYVTHVDFEGFTGEDIKEFDFVLDSDGTLIYRGIDVGMTEGGTVFVRSEIRVQR